MTEAKLLLSAIICGLIFAFSLVGFLITDGHWEYSQLILPITIISLVGTFFSVFGYIGELSGRLADQQD